MKTPFYKYQGTGNDFVIIDDRVLKFPRSDSKLIARLCDRHFGIGADGLILLSSSDIHDFTMTYYNSHGKEGSLCGNGARCLVAFAHDLGLIKNTATFDAFDGVHYASIENGMVTLHMKDVSSIKINSEFAFLDTGSPHYVKVVKNIKDFDVINYGEKNSNNNLFLSEGVNVNFVEIIDKNTFRVRTYERGVENETLACGTGVTAVAIAMYEQKYTSSQSLKFLVEGGELYVSFKKINTIFKNIFLKGGANFVFKGSWEI